MGQLLAVAMSSIQMVPGRDRMNYKPFGKDDTLYEGQVCKASGYSGIALHAFGWTTEPDEETEWTGIEVVTDRVLCVMVGDDRELSIDIEDLEALPREDYCGECGQVGCTCDAYDRGGE